MRTHKDGSAETRLLAGYEGMKKQHGAHDERQRKAQERIIKLYEAWHEAESDTGYDAKATQWRKKLPQSGEPADEPE